MSGKLDFGKHHDGRAADGQACLVAGVGEACGWARRGRSACQHFGLHLSFRAGTTARRSGTRGEASHVPEERLVCSDLVQGPDRRAGRRAPFSASRWCCSVAQNGQARRARGSLLPSRGAAVARRGRGRQPALRLSRPDLRRQRAVRFSSGAGHGAVERARARLSGRRALQRGLDLDGRSGPRRRHQDRRTALARRQRLDADAGLSAHRGQRAAPGRQPARLYPRRASP